LEFNSIFSYRIIIEKTVADYVNVDVQYISYSIWILVLDALVVIPFSKLRAYQRPVRYAAIKIGNVVVNLGLNFFFYCFCQVLPSQIQRGFSNNLC